MIDDLAVRWYSAEKLPTDPRWGELPVRRQDEIRKRVKLVLDGEVRKSECSPGDLAVWFGRFRELKAPGHLFKDNERQEMIHCVFYDSLDILGPPIPGKPYKGYETLHSTRLFGNMNIGNREKSNLQVAGQMPGHQMFHITRTWISVPTEEGLAALWDRVLERTVITYVVGDHPRLELPARELWSDPRPTSIVIPPRQCYGVHVEFYGNALQLLKDAVRGRDPERDPVRLVVFLEGWVNQEVW